MFEQPHHDWAPSSRREELANERPIPSPTYSQPSHDGQSPYNMPLNAVPSAYAFQSTSTQVHPRYSHQPQYNSSGEYDVFQTPTPARRSAYEYQPVVYDGQQPPALLSSHSLGRTYDSTIPQYYPVMTDRSWGPTPDKEGSRRRGKGKGAMGTPTPASKQSKSKRAKGSPDESGREAKRARRGSGRAAPPPQLPTPPPSGGDPYMTSLPSASTAPTETSSTYYEHMPMLASPDEPPRRSGVRVTRSDNEGRKLAVGQMGDDGELSPVENHPPRFTPAPLLTMGEDGQATLVTKPILESDLSWMEHGGRAPPESPQTPERAAALALDEPADPAEEARLAKRLEAFTTVIKSEEPMVCTRIDSMGRVAVRKDVAARFLGLDQSASLVEETRQEDEDEWIESISGSSRAVVRPLWPDDQAPWSMSSGTRRDRRAREQREKSALLRRYLETSNDEASDEEELRPSTSKGKGKGKSVARLITAIDEDPRRQRAWETGPADARMALLNSLRSRPLPPAPMGIMACACGGVSAAGPMVSCSHCRTWHHAACAGVEEGSMDWWCPTCSHNVLRPSTPARGPLRVYTQSEERSAFKGQIDHIALAPSPMFPSATFSQALRTPINRVPASPSSRNHRSRILSYGGDLWPYNDDATLPTPSTPAPDNRFTTPRIDDVPFDVTSTPSRHIDFNFGGPSMFSLTPLGGRSRVVSGMADTPLAFRNRLASNSELPGMSGRHDFLRDLGDRSTSAAGPSTSTATASLRDVLGSPQATKSWPHALLGAHNLSPSPFGHKRSLSGNKFSSMRSSSRSGLGLGMPLAVGEGEGSLEEEDEEEEEGAGPSLVRRTATREDSRGAEREEGGVREEDE